MLAVQSFGQAIDRFNPDTIKTIELDSTVKITARKFGIETFINAYNHSFHQLLFTGAGEASHKHLVSIYDLVSISTI